MEQLFPPEQRIQMRRAAVELFRQGKFDAASSLVGLLMTLEEQPLSMVVMYAICLIETGQRERAGQLITHVDKALASSPQEEQESLRPLLEEAHGWTPGRWAGSSKDPPSGSLVSAFMARSKD